MATTAILWRNDGCDHAAFMLLGIRIIFVGLVTVQAVDVSLRMGTVLPLVRQTRRSLAVTFDARLSFFQSPTSRVQRDLGSHDSRTEKQHSQKI